MDKKFTSTIRNLYPDLIEQEIAEAEDNFERYLALALRVFERVKSETNPQADQLTESNGTLSCTPSGSESSD